MGSSVVFVGDQIGFAERNTPKGVTEYWVRFSDVVRTPGERYLIHADDYATTFEWKSPELTDVLFPATCGYTGPAAMPRVRPIIARLQAWSRAVRKSGVTGGVYENARTRYGTGWPVVDAEVTLTGEGVKRQARSTADGVFAFFDLSPGNYRIQARREGFAPEKDFQEITVTQGACEHVEAVLKRSRLPRAASLAR